MSVAARLGAPTTGPIGWWQFASAHPDQAILAPSMEPVEWTPLRRTQLFAVNDAVNAAIKGMPDPAAVACNDLWSLSPAEGDCNDFAVTKRRDLLALGWPASCLLLAECVLQNGMHHLVLVVRTTKSDMVLDSLTPAVLDFVGKQVDWLRIQMPQNPNFWATVTPTG